MCKNIPTTKAKTICISNPSCSGVIFKPANAPNGVIKANISRNNHDLVRLNLVFINKVIKAIETGIDHNYETTE